jgi:hypothetical protein
VHPSGWLVAGVADGWRLCGVGRMAQHGLAGALKEANRKLEATALAHHATAAATPAGR